MPRLSVWFIRAALSYLALGFTFGGLLLLNKALPLHPMLWSLLPGHIEFVLYGWTVQLAMGMAFWILPRFSKPPLRGNEKLAWGAFVLVNLGIWLWVVAAAGAGGPWLSLAGRLAETAGILLFTVHAWPRIKGIGLR